MKVKFRIALRFPILVWKNYRARVLAKKIKKWKDENRYSEQWKMKYVLKHSKKFLKLMKVKLIVKGYDNLPKGSFLLTPNHSSSFDAAILIASLENPNPNKNEHQLESVYLAKKELKKNRFSGYMDILHTFYINRNKPREALSVMNDFMGYAKKYKKIAVVFPEGTRSLNGEVGEFKGGAFRIAKQTFIPIVPMTINNAWSASNFNRKQWLNVEVIFDKPIKPMTFISQDTKTIAERVEKVVKSNWKKPVGKRSKAESKHA